MVNGKRKSGSRQIHASIHRRWPGVDTPRLDSAQVPDTERHYSAPQCCTVFSPLRPTAPNRPRRHTIWARVWKERATINARISVHDRQHDSRFRDFLGAARSQLNRSQVPKIRERRERLFQSFSEDGLARSRGTVGKQSLLGESPLPAHTNRRCMSAHSPANIELARDLRLPAPRQALCHIGPDSYKR